MTATTTDLPTEHVDVVVVGSGLGAGIAALTAAKTDPDATVHLVRPNPDQMLRHPGTIDVLGYQPPQSADQTESTDDDAHSAEEPTTEDGWSGPVSRPFEAMAALPQHHPYCRLGEETVREALSVFDEVVDYRGGSSTENALLPTHVGRVRPTSRYPPSMASGLLSRRDPIRLVGFEQLPDFDASFVAAGLDATLPYDVQASTIEFPGTITEYPPGLDLARALDEDEQPTGDVGAPAFDVKAGFPDDLVGSDDSQPLREPLLERLDAVLDIEPRLGVPAILGKEEAANIRERFENRLGVDIFEVPISSPSVPGNRLRDELSAALVDANVSIQDGDVTDFEEDQKAIVRVSTDEHSFEVEAVVLATGGLATGGLVTDREGIHEPRFGCPVDAPDDRTEWTKPDPLDTQPFDRYGVTVDEDLRPVDDGNEPMYANLHTVGTLIGDVDFVAEQSADGVAIATGFAAANSAL